MPEEGDRLRALRALRAAAQGLSDATRERDVLDVLMARVRDVLPAERVLVRLSSPGDEGLELAASTGLAEDSRLRAAATAPQGSLHRKVLDGELVVLEMSSRDLDFPFREAAEGEGLKGVVAAPMMLRGRAIGVVEVYCDDVKSLTPEDLLLLDTLTDLAAISIEKVRLYQSLFRIAAHLNGAMELEPMLESVLAAAVKEMGLKAAVIRLLDPNERVLRLVASHGLSERYRSKGDVHAAESSLDRPVLKGETVVLHDVEREPGLQYPEAMSHEGIRSVLTVPIRLKDDRVLGLVRVYSARPREFGSVATDYLSSVADLVAVAIERAELYRKLKSSYDELKLDLAELRRFLALG